MNSAAMDEQLISEVQHHAVIYNRQKYFLNHGSPAKYESKDQAWNYVAMKLGTDVDSCKKRWKYLRERYVQQRKQQQTDTPTYEHLSRPYLERMTFLDEHIQPRKSYRNVPSFLNSSSSNAPFGEYIDSSRSNGSVNGGLYTNYPESYNTVKCEPEHTFHNFSAANDNQPQTEFSLDGKQAQQPHPDQHMHGRNQQQSTEFRESGSNNIPSSSSSLKSPLSSPPVPESNDNCERAKRTRVEIANEIVDDDGDSSNNEPQIRNSSTPRYNHRRNPTYPNNLLYSLYQQYPGNGQVRSTEHLFGELVTSELLKMNREKRRSAQKRILEVLFFDD